MWWRSSGADLGSSMTARHCARNTSAPASTACEGPTQRRNSGRVARSAS